MKTPTDRKLVELRKRIHEMIGAEALDEAINELLEEAIEIEDTERAVELFLAARLLYIIRNVRASE